jgi:hypothetical protein
MKKEKSLLLLMAAASVGAAHAAPPASIGEEMSIVKVQEKGHTFVKGRVIDSEGNPLVGVTVSGSAFIPCIIEKSCSNTLLFCCYSLFPAIRKYFPVFF